MDKKVYVVIVTFNGINRNWIDKCLGSLNKINLLSNTIVIDNNSTDGSSNYIHQQFPAVFLIALKVNIGFGKANNIGIKKAYDEGADYVFLLNQDAWIEQDTINLLIQAQLKEQQFGIVSPMHLNGAGNALDYRFSNYLNPIKCKNLVSDIFLGKIKKDLYESNFVNAAAWLISRRCISIVGGFNPCFFHYGEDVNYIHRLHFHGLKVGILPNAVIYHDREERNHNLYFDDLLVAYKRTIILKASNPLMNFAFNLEYKRLFKSAIKSVVYLEFVELKELKNKIKILAILDRKQILKCKNSSKSVNHTFLHD